MLRKILLVLTAVAALIGLASAPASAQYGTTTSTTATPTTTPTDVQDGTLDSDQFEVSPGCTFTLFGDGFDPNTTYEIGSIYEGPNEDPGAVSTNALPNDETSTDLGTVTTDADGSFSLVLPIDPGARLGFYAIGIDTTIQPTGETGPDGEVIYSAIDVIEIEVVADATCTQPVTVTTAAPTNGVRPAAANRGTGNGTLARTGSNTTPLVAGGLGLLAAGGGLLVISRRRLL